MFSLIHDIRQPEAIKKALVTTSGLYVISKIISYLKNFAIAAFLGFSYKTDAFFFSVGIIGIFSIFALAFDSVGIPYLVESNRDGSEKFDRSVREVFAINVIVALLFSAITALALPIISRVGWGFSAETRELTTAMLWIMFPTVGLSFFYNNFAAILRAQRLFTIQTIGEVVLSLTQFIIIAGGLFFWPNPLTLAWASLISMLLSVLWQLCFVAKHLNIPRGDITLKNLLFFAVALLHAIVSIFKNKPDKYGNYKQTKILISQFLMFSAIYAAGSIYAMIDKTFASFLQEKAISALYYGSLIALVPIGVVRLETMFFTAISEKKSLRMVYEFIFFCLAVTVPYTLALFFFPEFIVKLILGYGRFGALDTALTAEALRYYVLALPALYMSGIFSRILIVKERFVEMFALLSLNIVLNIVMNYIFMFHLHLGLRGLVIATVIVAYADLLLRVWLVKRKHEYWKYIPDNVYG